MSVTALVIQLNSWQYLCNDGTGTIGRIMTIPCTNQEVDGDYWAVPIKDSGIFSRLQYVLVTDSPTAPTYDSFRVFRITDKLTDHTFWIRGTSAQYTASCDVCCGDSPIAMPTDVPQIVPCQVFCDIRDGNGNYQAIFAIDQPISPSGKLYVEAAYNNVKFTPAGSTAGYANAAAVLTFINGNWTTAPAGSPIPTLTWTLSADGMTLIVTGGNKNDSICFSARNIFVSP